MSLLRAKNGVGGGGGGGINGRDSDMPTMRPVSMGRPLVTMSTYQERGETLKRTSIMPDDSCYRNNNNNNNNNSSSNNNNNNNNANKSSNASNNGSNRMSLLNGGSNNIVNGSTELPPPPPQFANPQQKQPQQKQPQQQQQLKLNLVNGSSSSSSGRSKQLLSPVRSPSIHVGGLRAPATPQPDYDAAAATAATTTNGSQQQQQQRRTLRLGTVTIGEYGEQRGKRETLRKMPSIGSEAGGQSNGILKNGSNRNSLASNFSGSNNNSNNNSNGNSSSSSSNNISNGRHQQQLQHTEKSIKFGN